MAKMPPPRQRQADPLAPYSVPYRCLLSRESQVNLHWPKRAGHGVLSCGVCSLVAAHCSFGRESQVETRSRPRIQLVRSGAVAPVLFTVVLLRIDQSIVSDIAQLRDKYLGKAIIPCLYVVLRIGSYEPYGVARYFKVQTILLLASGTNVQRQGSTHESQERCD
jgi:hypothetical protein